MKKILLVFAMVLIAGIVAIAAPSIISGQPPDLTDKDTTVEVEKGNKAVLQSIGCGNPLIGELVCDDTTCRAKMTNTDGNVGCGGISIPARYCSTMDVNCGEECECVEYTEYTNAELLDLRDAAIKTRLEGIAEATIKSQEKSKTTQLGKGSVTVNEKK